MIGFGIGILGTLTALILLYLELRWIKEHYERIGGLDAAEFVKAIVDAMKSEGKPTVPQAENVDDLFFGDTSETAGSVFLDAPADIPAQTEIPEHNEPFRDVSESEKPEKKIVLECAPRNGVSAKRVLSPEELEKLKARFSTDESVGNETGGELIPSEIEYSGFARRDVRDAEVEEVKIKKSQTEAILAMLRVDAEMRPVSHPVRLREILKITWSEPKDFFWPKLYILYVLGLSLASMSILMNIGYFAMVPGGIYSLAFWGYLMYNVFKRDRARAKADRRDRERRKK